jgi:glycosyltransferase involved in cell wall biosynthesis
MKLFAALGPGDIVAAHRAQLRREPSSETQFIFSGQLLEYCRERGIETLALSYNRRVDRLSDGQLQLENRPRRFETSHGIRYHFSRIIYPLYLALRAHRFGADLALIDSGTGHYFALAFFRWLGIPIVINFHNVLWPNGFKPRGWSASLICLLNGWFFGRIATATAGISPECRRQVEELTGHAQPFFEYRSQYRFDSFRQCANERKQNPFRVVYVGRVERNKGALDIPRMAERIRKVSPLPIVFEVCGEGISLPELRRIVAEAALTDRVIVHGRLSRQQLLELYARSNVIVVPTRSDFCEGLPAVCAEAVISGIPIITSRLSNAIPVLGAAVAEASPEDIESFVQAILRVAEDQTAYNRLCEACPKLARQFFDRFQSYPAAIDRLISHIFPNWKPLDSYDAVFERLM